MRYSHRLGLGLASMLGAACSSPGQASYDSSFTITVLAPTAAGGTVPLAGAAVAVDTGDGARHEARTDETGNATLGGLDLDIGFSLTVAAPGYVAVSDLGLAQTGGSGWTVTLSPFGADPTWIDVSGIVRGRPDANDFVNVSASIPSTNFEGLGAQYALRVAPGQPFTVVVAEETYGSATASAEGSATLFTAWAAFPQLPVTAMTNLDLAMPRVRATPGATSDSEAVGESLMPATGQGMLLLPPSMVGARGEVSVSSAGSSGSLFLGGTTSMTLDPDGTDLDYQVEWVSPVSDLVTTYSLSLDGAWSYARSEGMPGGSISFIDPPSVSSPLSMSSDIVVNRVAPAARLVLNIVRDDRSTGWRVFQQGASVNTIHIPKLPSAIDPRVVLGTGEVTVVPEACVAGSNGFCTQYADGAPGTLVTP